MNAKTGAISELEVILDLQNRPRKIGMLSHDRGQIRFEYDPKWLADEAAFQIDPNLTLAKVSIG